MRITDILEADTHRDSPSAAGIVGELQHGSVDRLDLDFFLLFLDQGRVRIVRQRPKIQAASEPRRDCPDPACIWVSAQVVFAED